MTEGTNTTEAAYLKGLNDAQKRAVLHKDGPLLIIAGAGAGKTRVLTHRMLHLIKNGVPPSEILAITFTNKAAKEMRERVMELIEKDRELNLPITQNIHDPKPFVSTFHALGVHIIKENAKLLGLKRHFTIFDRADSIRAIKEAMKRADVDSKQFEPRKILGLISRQKGDGVSLSEFMEHAGNDYMKRMTLRAWEGYEKILKDEHALDFDDLLLKSMQLLEENETVRETYNKTWRYILIDEYQDTNKVQYRMTELLAGGDKNLCVVGDIDQNIYSWRGADIENLLNFENTYPGTTTILLEENYRSTRNIIDASNAIIEKNTNRVPKTLFTNAAAGEKITALGAYDEAAEAHYITQMVDELHRSGVPYREMAVLYRTNFQSRVLEEVFMYEDIPYQLLGTKFFDRKEVKDVLAYLRAALNPENTADIKRIVSAPPRGIGKVTLLRMVQNEDHLLTPAVQKRVGDFRALLARIRECALTRKPSETMRFIITESGLETHFKTGKEEDMERLANVHELVSLAQKYDGYEPQDGVERLLEDAALTTDQDSLAKDHNAVKLMTVHASKGLEFDYVFVSGLEEGLFPQERNDERDSEEERRLFYVALTRARRKVFLTFCGVRTIFGSKEIHLPSEFISDIPPEYLEEGGDTPQETHEKHEFLVIE